MSNNIRHLPIDKENDSHAFVELNKQQETWKENVVSNPIEPHQIEKELQKIHHHHKSNGHIQASLFNLIIFTKDTGRSGYFREMTEIVLERFPCRIIFIQGDSNYENEYLKVHVASKLCGKNNPSIVCDEIFIEVAGKHVSNIPQLILPHITPDLPVYLLWGQDPSEDQELFPYLSKFATRLIFDAGCSINLKQFSSSLNSLLRTTESDIVDTNWAKLGGWRRVIAQVFDTPEKIQQLTNAKTVRITYNNTGHEFFPHCEIQAIYLQGWIAAQMTWRFDLIEKSEGNIRITYHNGIHPVIVILATDQSDKFSPGTITQFESKGSEGEHVKISRKTALSQVTIEVSTEQKCEIPYNLALSTLKKNLSFMKQLFYDETNKQYENMLKVISLTDW